MNKCIGSGSMISTGVCGTNGEYYKTVCLLNIAKCNSKGKIGDHQVGKCCKIQNILLLFINGVPFISYIILVFLLI